MDKTIALIGFGEAASSFADAARWGASAQAYDIKVEQNATRAGMLAAYGHSGVTACETFRDAVDNAQIVLSLVSADAALTVAETAAQSLATGCLFLDMNSVAPQTKRDAADVISRAGGRYADVAVMAPVNPAKLAVPLLVSGPDAEVAATELSALGFTHIRVVGDEVGRASTIKMLRSVMYKGMEALTAECLMACGKAGVMDEVLASFGNDWATSADYRIDRMMTHGLRRAAEMEEVIKTLKGLGVEPHMTCGTVQRQREIGALGAFPPPSTLDAKLDRLLP